MKALVTGAAGFIGSRVMGELARRGDTVVGLDNFNDYYDVALKKARLAAWTPAQGRGERRRGSADPNGLQERPCTDGLMPGLTRHPGDDPDRPHAGLDPASRWSFHTIDIADKPALDALFAAERFDIVVHMAAQAGVRYSIGHPYECLESNVTGFLNVLEACRHNGVRHLVFASSSSVYGQRNEIPFSEADKADSPVSLYAATKRADELMAHAYSQLYGFASTGLRFFTVYGPWGRPDMAPMRFARAILAGEPIELYNNGDMVRDFTYIDDVVEGIVKVIDSVAGNPAQGRGERRRESADTNGVMPGLTRHPGDEPTGLYRIYNIGSGHPVRLTDFIAALEEALGRKATVHYLPMQPGDVYQTAADTSLLARETGFTPRTSLDEGLKRFAEWYKEYYT